MLPSCPGATLVHASVRHRQKSDHHRVEASSVLICKMDSLVGPCGKAVLMLTCAVHRGAEATAPTPRSWPALLGTRGHIRPRPRPSGGLRAVPSPVTATGDTGPPPPNPALATSLPKTSCIYAAYHQNQWCLLTDN